jgi:gentisate 1,2-dioxygenase
MPYKVSRTLGGLAERLNAGKSSLAVRETASSVYHVIEGAGYTIINGEKHEWVKGDTFCIPAWHKYQHFASTSETVYLYRFDDKPMLRALGFLKTEGQSDDSLVTEQ